jgi:hypothetical protein
MQSMSLYNLAFTVLIFILFFSCQQTTEPSGVSGTALISVVNTAVDSSKVQVHLFTIGVHEIGVHIFVQNPNIYMLWVSPHPNCRPPVVLNIWNTCILSQMGITFSSDPLQLELRFDAKYSDGILFVIRAKDTNGGYSYISGIINQEDLQVLTGDLRNSYDPAKVLP